MDASATTSIWESRGLYLPKSVSQFSSSLISSPRRAAGSAPNPVITGEYKQLLQVLIGLLICFSTAQCHYIANCERMHHQPTRVQQEPIQPRQVGELCGG